jgi:two-component system, OmpR family, response regulator
MRVLVVEDDKKIASFVSRGLKEAGYAVDVADRGDDGLHAGLNNGYDVAVVDLMLPGLDGLNVIERWRAQKVKMPVLILSAKRSVDDRVKGLQAGSDDYLTKPFAFSELLARIQALVRRATQTAEPASLTYADLTVDLLSREVTRGGRRIELQAQRRARGLQDHDPRTRLGLRLRPQDQRDRRARFTVAEQDRPRFRPQTHPYHAWLRLRAEGR